MTLACHSRYSPVARIVVCTKQLSLEVSFPETPFNVAVIPLLLLLLLMQPSCTPLPIPSHPCLYYRFFFCPFFVSTTHKSATCPPRTLSNLSTYPSCSSSSSALPCLVTSRSANVLIAPPQNHRTAHIQDIAASDLQMLLRVEGSRLRVRVLVGVGEESCFRVVAPWG